MRIPRGSVLMGFLALILLESGIGATEGGIPWPEERSAWSVGVMDLDALGVVSSDEAVMLSNRLRIELFRMGAFEVMERNKMAEILEEQEFQLSGCTDQACVVQVGKIIGVQG